VWGDLFSGSFAKARGIMEELGLFVMILAAVIAWDLIKRLFSNYIGEKGKNLATKEDIGEITEKIEGVKSYFTDRTEWLRAKLSVNSQQKMNLFINRNEAHIQFYKDFYKAAIFLRSPIHFRPEEVKALDEHIKEGRELITRSFASYFGLMVYVQKDSISTPAHKAVTALIELERSWFRLMIEFRNALAIEAEEREIAKATYNNVYIEQSLVEKPSDQIFNKYSEGIIGRLDTLENSLKEYAIVLNAHFQSVDNSKALTAKIET
jgi:hypothetical protein